MSIISPDSLMMAWATSGVLDVTAFTHLINAGASMHCVDERGRSPLLLAVLGGHVDTVRYLMELGADGSWRDTDGRDAASYARSTCMLEALGVLPDTAGRNTSMIEARCADMKLT
ncbi:g560 [Coccomyxa elongata]